MGFGSGDPDSIGESLHDVVIVGGGLAGLCLARQLRRELPALSVVVLDMLERPLPEAAFKVGEATVEMGAHYLAETLGLSGHLREEHLLKMGLRYYFGDPSGPFRLRPEMGLTEPPRFNSYLIDRGRLENHLRSENALAGVRLLEGVVVEDAVIDPGGDHQVRYRLRSGDGSGCVIGRWLIDATGRRRLLQRKLGLAHPAESRCSAAWFRVSGLVSVEDLVPPGEEDWHSRVQRGLRHHGVIHLLGEGYWVWVIALPGDKTSVGIVTDETVHPFSSYSTRDKAFAWLAHHEPAFADYLLRFDLLDFRVMRGYSYNADQVFSSERWACVGEAAVFADPFYAPGIDMIGIGNNIVVEMIRREMEGELSDRDVKHWNRWFSGFNQVLTDNIQNGYGLFRSTTAGTAKLIWDFGAAWGYEAPQILNTTYLDHERAAPMRKATARFTFLQIRMQRLFRQWAALPPGRSQYRFIDYFTLRYLVDLRDRNLVSNKSLDRLVEDAKVNMSVLEQVALALFLVAVEDQFPEHARDLRSRALNPYAVGLDPSRWEEDGLFQPEGRSGASAGIVEDLFRVFGVPVGAEAYVGA